MYATERDTERGQQLQVQYWHEIGAVNLEDLVFVDETGSNERNDTTLCPFSSRPPRRAYSDAPYQRGVVVTT